MLRAQGESFAKAERNKNEELRMQIHLEHGAIPAITIRTAEDIINPNPGVKRMPDIAG